MNDDDFSAAELEQLRHDKPKSLAERKRIAAELQAIAREHGFSLIGDVVVDERSHMATRKKTAENAAVKVERFTRNLRVVLKNDEVVERAKRSAFLLGEIQQKESERDAAKKQANAQIEELSSEMHRLSLEVRDGAAYRDVPCTRHFVYRLGVVEERRTDTSEIIHERSMSDRERQLELGGLAGPADAKAVAKELGDDVVGATSDDGIVDDDYVPEGRNKAPKPRKSGFMHLIDSQNKNGTLCGGPVGTGVGAGGTTSAENVDCQKCRAKLGGQPAVKKKPKSRKGT